jgi:preprotein translocase subunit YajC
VITKSGLHGEIHEVQDGVIVLKIAEKTRVTVEKSAVLGKAGMGTSENKS